MLIVKTEGLSKSYKKVPVVRDICLEIAAGQVYGFLGPNGSGKTTTLGMVLGIIHPDKGHISLAGSQTPAQLLAARRRVGGILEQPNFYPHLSGYDNLRIAAGIKSLSGQAIAANEIDRVLALVKLGTFKSREFRHYSLGMKQRLALASALIGQPELLILDEPTNGLDPEGMQEIRELILALAADGLTILLSTHMLNEVERTCTHTGIIKNGVLLMSCKVDELLRAPDNYRLETEHLQDLIEELHRYPGAATVSAQQDHVIVQLSDRNPARLNQHLALKGIYLSSLVPISHSLEQVFLQLTNTAEPSA